jgi:hypothetical protein
MSAENSVAPTEDGRGSATRTAGPEPSFSIPDELLNRYQVRVVEGSDSAERRVGLFLPGDRTNPALEIGDHRVIARGEDPETITALVKLAQHNGWSSIEVDGSAEFRKAVWVEGARLGLEVGGYEPSFAEREQADKARRHVLNGAVESPGGQPASPEAAVRGPLAEVAVSAPDKTVSNTTAGRDGRDLSDGDSRLLLRISALSEDRRGLTETLEGDMPRLARDVQVERVGENREALVSALDRALDSPSLTRTFERSGYSADDLRGMAAANEWDGDIADAIDVVRTGLHRDAMRKVGVDRGQSAEVGLDPGGLGADPAERSGSPAGGRRESGEALAELFLHGCPEQVAAEPRLASAVRAQGAMEQHIAEVFQGNAGQTATANLESRQMISDVLRRGLDVAVREPTPLRQIEPAQTLEMER